MDLILTTINQYLINCALNFLKLLSTGKAIRIKAITLETILESIVIDKVLNKSITMKLNAQSANRKAPTIKQVIRATPVAYASVKTAYNAYI